MYVTITALQSDDKITTSASLRLRRLLFHSTRRLASSSQLLVPPEAGRAVRRQKYKKLVLERIEGAASWFRSFRKIILPLRHHTMTRPNLSGNHPLQTRAIKDTNRRPFLVFIHCFYLRTTRSLRTATFSPLGLLAKPRASLLYYYTTFKGRTNDDAE
jgi:hypothetical protein